MNNLLDFPGRDTTPPWEDNKPTHRIHVHSVPLAHAQDMANRMTREGFHVFSVSVTSIMVPGVGGSLGVELHAAVSGRIPFSAPETKCEIEQRLAIDAVKNSRIIKPGMN